MPDLSKVSPEIHDQTRRRKDQSGDGEAAPL